MAAFDVDKILDDDPPAFWWAALNEFLIREKMLDAKDLARAQHKVETTSQSLGSLLRKRLLELLNAAVLDSRVKHPEKFVLEPWETWFLELNVASREARRGRPTRLDQEHVRRLVESGVAVFEQQPLSQEFDFAEIQESLAVPDRPALEWPIFRAWLYELTTVEFLRDYLGRRGIKLKQVKDEESKRSLWIKFKFWVQRRVRNRSDLDYMGIERLVSRDPRVSLNQSFRAFVESVDRDLASRETPYSHGDPLAVSPLDKKLEDGYVAILKQTSTSADPETTKEIAELETHLDDRFLVSWLSQRTQKTEADLWSYSHTVLYAMYLQFATCHDGHIVAQRGLSQRDLDRMLLFLNRQQLPPEPGTDAADLSQRFCQVQQELSDSVRHGDLSGVDKFHDGLLRFVRWNYVLLSQDLRHVSDDDLNKLAKKLSQQARQPVQPVYSAARLTRRLAHAVLNRIIETSVTEEEFLRIARERGLQEQPDQPNQPNQPKNLSGSSRQLVQESNTRRVSYFTQDLDLNNLNNLNLAEVSRELDLFWDKQLSGRALADSLMHQYLRLLQGYTDLVLSPDQIESVVREFVLKDQWFI